MKLKKITFLTLLILFSIPLQNCALVSTKSDIKYESINDILKPYLKRYKLPALAAAVIKDGTVIAAGAVGTRKLGSRIDVTINDRFHIGSDTKAITALLAAIMVEKGKLKWTSTLSDIFPELSDKMDKNMRTVTLEQLLSHTSGMPSDDEKFVELMLKTFELEDKNLDEIRYWMVSNLVKKPLKNKPGSTFAYSNMGYVTVGAMIEKVTGRTWEELVTEKIFNPLGLETAGFGPQASVGKIDAPVGHIVVDGKTKALTAGPCADNPIMIGPAGTVHMSILDFAKWATYNISEGKKGPKLVSKRSFQKLHKPIIEMELKKKAAPGTPSHGQYALGWAKVKFDWSKLPLLHHAGSNTKNLAYITLSPEENFGMVLMTNIGNDNAQEAFLTLQEKLYKKYCKK